MISNLIERELFKKEQEKSFLDKVFARKEIQEIRELMKKTDLERQDYLDLLYLMTSEEAKLVNHSAWSRYHILKFFVWIREFIKIAEALFDEKELLKKKKIELTPTGETLMENNKRMIEHIAKFLIDLYFNINRSTLSIGATGFMEALKNKYEFLYPSQSETIPKTERKKILGVI